MPRLGGPIHRLLSGQGAAAVSQLQSPRFWLYCIKVTFAVHFFSEYVGHVNLTSGPSMLPTLNASGDWVYISKAYRRGRGCQVGDIVSIKHPMFPETLASKRIVGMPGDYVLRDTPGSPSDMMIQVPEGHCWLAGDNVPWSRDSREYGPVPLALIRGKLIARVFPLGQFKWLTSTMRPVEDDKGFMRNG